MLEKTSEVMGKGAATALADGAVRTAEIAAPALEGASRGIGVEFAKVFAPYVGPGILLIAGAYSFTQLYPIGKEIYQYETCFYQSSFTILKSVAKNCL